MRVAARRLVPPLQQRYKLTLEYVGSAYRGSQSQPESQRRKTGPTVQDDLEAALARLVPRGLPPRAIFASRTDAGVHATGNVAHVDLARRDKLGAALLPYKIGRAHV